MTEQQQQVEPGSASLTPGGDEFVRPPKPGTRVPEVDGATGAVPPPAQAPVPMDPERTRLVRLNEVMSEVWIDNALIGVVQATSTAAGAWEFRHMPGWTGRESAEKAALAMCMAAVNAGQGH